MFYRVLMGLLAWLALATTAPAQSVIWVTNAQAFGPGSLRQAVLDLQPGATGVQEIRFALGSQTGTTIFLNQPMPDIRGATVRIDAADTTGGVIIDGGGHQQFRVPAGSTTTSLSVANLTLRRGGAVGNGGCISVAKAGSSLALDRVTLEECRAYYDATTAPAFGGAVFAAGPLTVRDSVFSGNSMNTLGSATVSANAGGGAIGKTGLHPVTVQRSRFRDNRVYLTNTDAPFCASGAGGAIYLSMPGTPGTDVVIEDSSFVNNSTPCRNPTVTYDIDGAGDGGGVYFYGEYVNLRFNANYFENNRGRRGGGIGIIGALASTPVVTNNTFHRNRANASGGGLLILNCCYSQVLNNTFSENVSLSSNYGGQFSLFGGGTLALFNNIAKAADSDSGLLCNASSGQISAGGNLYTRNDCPVAGDSSSQAIGAMPWLQAPTMSGGYVLSQRSDYGAPSIDSADEAHCVQYDVRGTVRPLDGDGDTVARCDVGAVENSLVDRLFKDGFED